MTAAQRRKYIRDRLNRALAKHYRASARVKVAVPPEVKHAQKIMKAWSDKLYAASKARDERILAAARVVEESMYRGDPNAALAAVKAFEAFKL